MQNNKLRKKMKTKIKIVAGLFFISSSAMATASSKYTAINLDELGFGDISVAAINESGDFAGHTALQRQIAIWGNGKETVIEDSRLDQNSVVDFNNQSQILTFDYLNQNKNIIYDNGSLVELQTLGGVVGAPWDINNNGQVAGHSSTDMGMGFYEIHATRWDNGNPVDLGTVKGNFTSTAHALNDNGDVVGFSGFNAVLWTDNKVISLDKIEGTQAAQATGINNLGQIIGSSSLGIANHSVATFWDSGDATATAIGTLGGLDSYAMSINDIGLVVGSSSIIDDGNQFTRGFIWEDGHIVDINSFMDNQFINSNFIISEARQITNNGLILAAGYNTSDGSQHDFLLRPISPVPEPSTWAMLLIGMGLLASYRIKIN